MSFRKRVQGAEAPEAASLEVVRKAAVTLLAARDHCSAELRQKLENQGYPAALAAMAVAELVAGKLLNDERFAQDYVHHHAERGQGPLRITQQLTALGLSSEIIDSAIAAGPDWQARAREVRIRRFGLEAPASWPEKAKQARFLQYRGFSSDHIRAAVGPDVDLNE